jgi:hypothetical protein
MRMCDGKLGQLIETCLTEYEAVVKGTDDDECHQQDHDSDSNIMSISTAGEDRTYEIVKKTISPPMKPRSPVGHAYYKRRQPQSVKGTRMSHMCPPFEFVVTSLIVFGRPLIEKHRFPYYEDNELPDKDP